MKQTTFDDAQLSRTINATWVPVVLEAEHSRQLVHDLQITAYPTTVLVSPDGKVLAKIEGYVTPSELSQRLARALAPRPSELASP